jgi:8-oxo-dGTP pyrophosphatase MutT (NUDIX family)
MTDRSTADRYLAAGTFYARSAGKLLLHLRDEDAPISPGKWSVFGGWSEDEDGDDPIARWRREAGEELGVDVPRERISSIGVYDDADPRIPPRHLFSAEWPNAEDTFVLTEGQAIRWFTVEEARQLPNLSDPARYVIDRLL